MSDNSSMVGNDSGEFMELMDQAMRQIERVDRATNKANKSLKNYSSTFNSVNKQLEEYVSLSGDMKSNKFQKPTSVGGGQGASLDKEIANMKNKANKAIGSSADAIFNSVNSLGGKYGKVLTKNISGVMKTINNTKETAKATKDIGKYTAEMAIAGKATTGATKTIKALGSSAGVAAGVTAGLVAVIGLMSEAGKYAYERNMKVNRSLMQMGVASDELTSSSVGTANKMIHIKNTWGKIGEDLTSSFEPVFSLVVDFVDTIGTIVGGATAGMNKEKDKNFNYADDRVRGYTNKLQNKSGELESTSIPTIADISSSAKQSGFTNESAANLGIGTYDTAMKLAREYGVEASDVAKKLSDAWLNGSDAAKEYGVVVDDQVLAGFMSTKGVDIVNTEISDAMKQYYRYQLLQEQTSAANSDHMQDNIKKWKQLGMSIDGAKGKLFNFDEVIQLSARDTTIPDIGKKLTGFPGMDKEESNKGPGIIPPILPGPGVTPPPLKVPVEYFEPAPYVAPVVQPINVPVYAPGLSVIPELVVGLGILYGMLPLPVTLPVTIPGLELIPGLVGQLEEVRGKSTVPVQIPVTVPGFELAPRLLEYMQRLSVPVMSTVMFGIPALGLAPQLLGYLGEIATTWTSTVNINVAGQAVLERALSTLREVQGLLGSMGQATVEGARNVVSHNVSQARSFGKGFAGQTNKGGVLDSWAPTSSKAYGDGLFGALRADLDLNLVRTGMKKQTKEGFSTKDIVKSQASYAGMNANPFNKNSAANLLVKGTAASGALAAGYGTIAGVSKIASALKVAGGGSKAASGIKAASSGLKLGGFSGSMPSIVPAFASGGIGTKEVNNATLFEGNKAEAVIPLETPQGIEFLSDAMREAGAGGGQSAGNEITVNLTLSGINIADEDSRWEQVGNKIAEVIDVQRQRRGELTYGS